MNKIGAIENLNKDFVNNLFKETKKIKSCLLYTSDAADE